MRNAKDRFPNLSLLRVLILLGLFQGAILQRHRRVFRALDQADVGLFAGYLLRFFWIFGVVHLITRSLPLPVLTPLLQRNICARVVELVLLALWPFIEFAHIHHNLTFRIQFDVRAIHRPRRGPFEVDRFTVVTAAMTRTLEFVLAWFPVRRAA